MFTALAETRTALLRSSRLSTSHAGPSRQFSRSSVFCDSQPSSLTTSQDSKPQSVDSTSSNSASSDTQATSVPSSSSSGPPPKAAGVDDEKEFHNFLGDLFKDETAPFSETPSPGPSSSTHHSHHQEGLNSASTSTSDPNGDLGSHPAFIEDASPESFGASSDPSSSANEAKRELKSLESMFDRIKPKPFIWQKPRQSQTQSQTQSQSQPQSDSKWSPESLQALRGSKWDRKEDGHIVSPRVTSRHDPGSRILRGVHGRDKRKMGQTPQEAKAFDEVLAGIFADLERHGSVLGRSNPTSDPFGGDIGSGISKWQKSIRSRKPQTTFERSESAPEDEVLEELDRLKEEMSSMATDAEVLQWAQESVFKPKSMEDGHPVYSAAYPHILSQLLRTVRTNFNNPNLALALFQHAQTISLESYMAGCLTGAYNELITIRWDCFKDLEGVEAAAREMDVNGIGWDRFTRNLIARVCEQVSTGMLGSKKTGAWGDSAEQSLRALEERVEIDIAREQEILESKAREAKEARLRAARAQFAPQSRPHRGREDRDMYDEEGEHDERMRASA